MAQSFFTALAQVNIFVTGQVLKDCAGFGRSNSSERIRALALELVAISPSIHVRKASRNSSGDCWDSSRISEKPEIKHDVFMTLVSVQIEQFNQKW